MSKEDSPICKQCKHRISNKQKTKMNCQYCLKCRKKYIELLELNQFIERMNEKHDTNVKTFDIKTHLNYTKDK